MVYAYCVNRRLDSDAITKATDKRRVATIPRRVSDFHLRVPERALFVKQHGTAGSRYRMAMRRQYGI